MSENNNTVHLLLIKECSRDQIKFQQFNVTYEPTFQVHMCEEETASLDQIKKKKFDLILFDDVTSEDAGNILEEIREVFPETSVMVTSGKYELSQSNPELEKAIKEFVEFKKPEKKALASEEAKSSNPYLKRLLVVDDEEVIHLTLDRILVDSEIEVEHAYNAQDALDRIHEGFEVVFTDIRMPGMDGIELLRRIKQIDSNIEVIVATAFASVETAVKSTWYGAHAYLNKPFEDLEEVLTEIEGAFNRRRNTQKNEKLYEAIVNGDIDALLLNGKYYSIPYFRYDSPEVSKILFGTLNDGMLFVNQQGIITFVNLKLAHILGQTYLDLIGKPFTDFLSGINKKDFREALSNIHKRKRAVLSDIRLKSKKDVEIPMILNLSSFFVEAKQEEDIMLVLSDLTDLQRVQERVETLASLVEHAQFDAVLIYNDKNEVLDANLAAERLFDKPKNTLKGMFLHELIQQVELDCFQLESSLTSPLLPKEGRVQREDKTTVPIEISASKMEKKQSKEKNGMLFIRDITERKQAQQAIQKAEQLEAIGNLAGGIAHDFNNFLTVIIGGASLAKEYLKPEDKSFPLLVQVERASEKAANLANQLLTFSRGGSPLKRVTSLEPLLQEVSQFALSDFNIECQLSFSQDLWPVSIDIEQVKKVFNNLFLNSQEAMPSGGKILVETENIIISKDDTESDRLLDLKPGPYVKIAIKNEGTEILEENLAKIFEPYFTTKKNKSGLGLSTVYSIIKRHNGSITVHSSKEEGTVFNLYFLAAQKSQEKAHDKINAPQPLCDAKGKTILIMDDEDYIQKIAGQMLKHLGYEAVFSSRGEEALKLYEEAMNNGKVFDAVMMDLTIPEGMGGEEAIGKFRELDPNVKAIISSGYSNDPIMSDYQKYGFSGIVTKPYKLQQIKEILQEVLNHDAA